jgi:hypothetical protein
MFYVFNTVSGKYVLNDHATAFRGKPVPRAFYSEVQARAEIDRRDWMPEDTFAIHTTIMEEALNEQTVIDA